MSKKVRERAEMRWWSELCKKHEVTIGHGDLDFGERQMRAHDFYDELVEHIEPEVERSAADVMADLFSQLGDYFRNMAPGTDIPPVDAIMKDHGMDPSIRADRYAIQKFMKDSELLTRIPSSPERYIRRITTNNGGAAAASSD